MALAGQPAKWQPPRPQDVKSQAFAWAEAKKVDPSTRAKVEAAWADLPATVSEDDLLVRLAQTFALLDPDAAKLLELCSKPRSRLVAPAETWLRDGRQPPLFAANLRLLYARWLVEESLFDEAQEQLAGLGPSDVVAPASLLFYQSVVSHALLNKESGLKSLDELLAGADASPRRYVALGRLMQDDLKGLKDGTLDHIARQMDDIRRRLDLGRAGTESSPGARRRRPLAGQDDQQARRFATPEPGRQQCQ